jgi:hypothetical protein
MTLSPVARHVRPGEQPRPGAGPDGRVLRRADNSRGPGGPAGPLGTLSRPPWILPPERDSAIRKRSCTSARTFGSPVRPTAAHWVTAPGTTTSTGWTPSSARSRTPARASRGRHCHPTPSLARAIDCHSTPSFAVTDCHSSRICTLILLSLPSFLCGGKRAPPPARPRPRGVHDLRHREPHGRLDPGPRWGHLDAPSSILEGETQLKYNHWGV